MDMTSAGTSDWATAMTSTASAAMPSSTSGGMDMSMGGPNSCKISVRYGKALPTSTATAQSISTPIAPPHRIMLTLLQQAVRTLLHMLQFAVAYLIMLLAMYYNGYVIISIFIGAYVGSFVFGWQSLGSTV
ncbi:Copper Transporter integral membrane protein that functions in high affinity copper transport [Teratosphaeriaceae sp. CCFEE 6253]|nr:Copper Transporter integral membrane protein that functions in high affinity copper transport [Teratosphaeriaceae sp. CCFEE 6253]